MHCNFQLFLAVVDKAAVCQLFMIIKDILRPEFTALASGPVLTKQSTSHLVPVTYFDYHWGGEPYPRILGWMGQFTNCRFLNDRLSYCCNLFAFAQQYIYGS